eukprot:1160760-Pelagomonas_calceolata.AAC.14
MAQVTYRMGKWLGMVWGKGLASPRSHRYTKARLVSPPLSSSHIHTVPCGAQLYSRCGKARQGRQHWEPPAVEQRGLEHLLKVPEQCCCHCSAEAQLASINIVSDCGNPHPHCKP